MMVTEEHVPAMESFYRQHPKALITTNLILLVLITIDLLVTTEAPVVLYQAF